MAYNTPGLTEYYDPEEIRRRALLAPQVDDATPDQESEVPASQTPSAVPTIQLSPAQQKYKTTLEAVPNAGDYKPSKWRRVAAALAGGFAGASGGSRAGVEAAQGIVSSPLQHALSGWQRSVQAASGGAGIEEKAMQEDVARRRASAYERSATARETAASATQAWRNYQAAHMPWQPSNMDEALTMEGAKHPQPTTKYGGFPSLEDYMKAHPVKPYVNPMDVENQRHKNRMSEQAAHDSRVAELRKSIQKQASPATPQQQNEAEHLAAQRLVRTNPEYANFYDQGGTKVVSGKVVRTPPRIKGAEELPKAGGGFLGMGGVSAAQESLAREKYRQFLSDLDKEKRRIMGSKAPADNNDDGDFDIMEEDEDEGDGQ